MPGRSLLAGRHCRQRRRLREPLPWFAVDLHAATVGLPQAEGWVPVGLGATPVARPRTGAWRRRHGLSVPARHLITFGFGASLISGEGQRRVADDHQRFRSNRDDAHHTGRAHRHHQPGAAAVDQLRTQAGMELPERGPRTHRRSRSRVGRRRHDAAASWCRRRGIQALNFGGGARWFMKPHLGAGFDVRFVKLGSRSATDDVAGGEAHAGLEHQRGDFDPVVTDERECCSFRPRHRLDEVWRAARVCRAAPGSGRIDNAGGVGADPPARVSSGQQSSSDVVESTVRGSSRYAHSAVIRRPQAAILPAIESGKTND